MGLLRHQARSPSDLFHRYGICVPCVLSRPSLPVPGADERPEALTAKNSKNSKKTASVNRGCRIYRQPRQPRESQPQPNRPGARRRHLTVCSFCHSIRRRVRDPPHLPTGRLKTGKWNPSCSPSSCLQSSSPQFRSVLPLSLLILTTWTASAGFTMPWFVCEFGLGASVCKNHPEAAPCGIHRRDRTTRLEAFQAVWGRAEGLSHAIAPASAWILA